VLILGVRCAKGGFFWGVSSGYSWGWNGFDRLLRGGKLGGEGCLTQQVTTPGVFVDFADFSAMD
jgi:hypothetical protein